jgi:hypothetical protein
MRRQKHQDAINVSISEGLRFGFRRPSFHRDAPKWFTLLVIGFFIAVIVAVVVPRSSS